MISGHYVAALTNFYPPVEHEGKVRELIAELGSVRAFHEQMKKDLRESCEQSDQLMKYR